MAIEVLPYSDEWPPAFDKIATLLRDALPGVPVIAIEHVGSTSVPGLAAKPVIDVDIIVQREHVGEAISALGKAGYRHIGDLGVRDREAFVNPDEVHRRNVYVCVEGTLNLRNHLAVRDVLRDDPALRGKYAALKQALSLDPEMDIATYTAAKSGVLREVLASSSLTDAELAEIYELNTTRIAQ